MRSRSKPATEPVATTKTAVAVAALRQMRVAALLPVTLALLCACGQTGPLFLPDTTDQSPELPGGSAGGDAGRAGAAAATDEDTEEGDAEE